MGCRRFVVIAFLFVAAANAGDTWGDIAPGPFTPGFRFERTVDPTRVVRAGSPGTPLGLAIWYPAASSAGQQSMTQLDYRLLEFIESLSPSATAAFVRSEADVMVNWRHVGIVPLTTGQATAAINAPGRAIRDARPVNGRFPAVVLLGGPWYLSTTAEILASHGHIVFAPVRPRDLPDEAPPLAFPSFAENAIRDAQWALSVAMQEKIAGVSRVTAIGHGGGGLTALLLAMRDRRIEAVINLDAGNFSVRTNPRQLAFHDPRLLCVPYLYLARAETRRAADQFTDFEAMRFSRRLEVILNDPRVRHHDLSDIGRPVSVPLGLRGDDAPVVAQTYAAVQDTILRFLAGESQFSSWLQQRTGTALGPPAYTTPSRPRQSPPMSLPHSATPRPPR